MRLINKSDRQKLWLSTQQTNKQAIAANQVVQYRVAGQKANGAK
jgi:hypothetical protein